MNGLKRFLAAATMSTGLLVQAAVLPAAIAPSALAAAPVAAAEQPAQAPQAMGKLIFIDPGHGGSDSGAVHKTSGKVDLNERDVNLDISQRLATLLRQAGYDVQMSREDANTPVNGNEGADLRARVDAANKSNADLLISVHNNGIANNGVHGTEVWYCTDRPFSDQNKELANDVQQALVRNLRQAGYDTQDRGIKDDGMMGHFAIMGPTIERPSTMPSVTGESLFMTNDQDASQLQKPEIRQAIAQGYFDGIQAYFGQAQSQAQS